MHIDTSVTNSHALMNKEPVKLLRQAASWLRANLNLYSFKHLTYISSSGISNDGVVNVLIALQNQGDDSYLPREDWLLDDGSHSSSAPL
jgi:hypothetical protein